jgi:hypothetical protein
VETKVTDIIYEVSLYGGYGLFGGLYGQGLYGMYGFNTKAIIEAPSFAMRSSISLDTAQDSQIHTESLDEFGVPTQTADITLSNNLYGAGLYGANLYGLYAGLYGSKGTDLHGVVGSTVAGTLGAYGVSKFASISLNVENLDLHATIDNASTLISIGEARVEKDLMATMVKVPLDRISLDTEVDMTSIFDDADRVIYESFLSHGKNPRTAFDEGLVTASITREELEQILNSFLHNKREVESYRVIADPSGKVDFIIVTIDAVDYPVMGDTVEAILIAIQDLINSLQPLEVNVDIKPGSCPHTFRLPQEIVDMRGELPVAILGIPKFDVTQIDPATVVMTREGYEDRLLPAVRWAYEDVATPYEGELCGCHDLNGDGLKDLTVKFSRKELAKLLNLYEEAGNTIPLTLTGRRYDGSAFTGKDCLRIRFKNEK